MFGLPRFQKSYIFKDIFVLFKVSLFWLFVTLSLAFSIGMIIAVQ